MLGETEEHTVISQSQGKSAWEVEAEGESKVSWTENSVLSGPVLCQSGTAQFCSLAKKNAPKLPKYDNL